MKRGGNFGNKLTNIEINYTKNNRTIGGNYRLSGLLLTTIIYLFETAAYKYTKIKLFLIAILFQNA